MEFNRITQITDSDVLTETYTLLPSNEVISKQYMGQAHGTDIWQLTLKAGKLTDVTGPLPEGV